MKTITGLLNVLSFSFCRHQNYTWPHGKPGSQYVACLDCGAELPYDMATMRVKKS